MDNRFLEPFLNLEDENFPHLAVGDAESVVIKFVVISLDGEVTALVEQRHDIGG